MEMLRRQFGIAEPVRRGMELKIAAGGEWKPAVLGGSSGIHGDILSGRDNEMGWEDVFTGEWFARFSSQFVLMDGVVRHGMHYILLCKMRRHR